MIIKLDFPDKALMPNKAKGRHWSVTSGLKEAQKDSAYWLTKKVMGGWKPTNSNIPLSILFFTPDKRHRDVDNMLASLKSGLDGIASALGVNDKQFKPLLIDWIQGGKPGAVVVAVGVQIKSGISLE